MPGRRRPGAVRERRDQSVAPPAVAGPHPPQVAVVLAPLEEVGERVLLDPGAAAVGQPLLLAERLDEVDRGTSQPEPERGRERLARGAGVDDALRLEPLERAHRRAVVAELGVVVVLDRDRAGLAQPLEQRRAPLAGEHDTGRVLVGRRQDDGVARGSRSRSTRRPCSSTSIGTGSRPAARAHRAVIAEARILEPDPRRSALRKGAEDQALPLA